MGTSGEEEGVRNSTEAMSYQKQNYGTRILANVTPLIELILQASGDVPLAVTRPSWQRS